MLRVLLVMVCFVADMTVVVAQLEHVLLCAGLLLVVVVNYCMKRCAMMIVG
jgi:hypothetical protein